jgi:UDP:flavonoid glycosyltransferase YjiC (YdhE family)
MKIGMQTWGSHGDIRPFLALAEGLQAAGNDVHLVITCVDNDAYEGMTSASGVKITVVASPVLTPEQQETVGRTAYAIRNPMTQMATILRLCLDPVEDAMFDAARRPCASAVSSIRRTSPWKGTSRLAWSLSSRPATRPST